MPEHSFPINIRLMHHEELYDVLNLIHRSIRELNSGDYSPHQLEKIVGRYNKSSLKREIVIVAEQQSQIIGIAKTSTFDKFLGYRTIQAMFVHPDFVRQGVGRTLMQELERRANADNIKALSVVSSLTAADFYEALGYSRLGEINLYGDVPCIMLNKELRPSTIIDRIIGLAILAVLILALIFGAFIIVALFLSAF